jgi:NADPH oxidase 2
VTKVIQHPSNVVEIQIKKDRPIKTRAGQYIFLCVPEISLWQYRQSLCNPKRYLVSQYRFTPLKVIVVPLLQFLGRPGPVSDMYTDPFTLTSAPEEDYISVHVRMVGNFTKALGKVLGCQGIDEGGQQKGGKPKTTGEVTIADEKDLKLNTLLPRVFIDGPFGSASEDVFKFETVLLIGAGIGVTPFASILKSIWYRMQNPSSERSRLRKVYFFWTCRDFGSLEWFRSLLGAIEAEDRSHAIEIHPVSKPFPPDSMGYMN